MSLPDAVSYNVSLQPALCLHRPIYGADMWTVE